MWRAISLARAAWEQTQDLRLHALVKIKILLGSPQRVALAAAGSSLLVGQAVGLGALERVRLDEDPLPLVALAGAAEAHHDRRQAARCSRAAHERRVS